MKEPQDSHEPGSVSDLHDRLVDRALAETLGGEMPPDLSARILAKGPTTTSERPTAGNSPLVVVRWSLLATAAMISIIATTVYLLSDAGSWKSARVSSKTDRLTKLEQVSGKRKTSRGAVELSRRINDAGGLNSKLSEQAAQQLVESPGPKRTKESLLGNFAVSLPALKEAGEDLDRKRSPSEGELLTVKDGYEPVAFGYRWTDDSTKDTGTKWGFPSSRLQQQNEVRGKFFSTLEADRRNDVLRGINPPIIFDGEHFDSGERRSTIARSAEGTGPGSPGDHYTRIYENPFIEAVGGDAVSTFSIDVDTASYANVRQFLMEMRQLPPPDAVRIEELVNYFRYNYAGLKADDEAPFAAHVEVAGCPWAPEHRLVRIGIKGREIERDHRPPSNLVFLVDVSGSMNEPNKLPLVVDGLRQLTHELGENDRVAIVVYASSEGLALESTRGDNQAAILGALDQLRAGGSTAGGAGIQLAYQIAEDHFVRGGTNRVILCTDGDFNVGVTSTAELERLVAKKAKDTRVFLSVLGFGRGNLNDAMMQTIADRGNGNHHYVDNLREARKVLVEEMTGTLVTIAKDVKIQVEFNPAQVAGYRLIGYENRMLRTEDFNDDTKDAGEIGAGHTVTALYEVIPAGRWVDEPAVDELKYQRTKKSLSDSPTDASGELLTLKMRYKQPEGDVSRKLERPTTDDGRAFAVASADFRFAAAVAEFGLVLRNSAYRGDATFNTAVEIAQSSLGEDARGYRAEFLDLVRRAQELQPDH